MRYKAIRTYSNQHSLQNNALCTALRYGALGTHQQVVRYSQSSNFIVLREVRVTYVIIHVIHSLSQLIQVFEQFSNRIQHLLNDTMNRRRNWIFADLHLCVPTIGTNSCFPSQHSNQPIVLLTTCSIKGGRDCALMLAYTVLHSTLRIENNHYFVRGDRSCLWPSKSDRIIIQRRRSYCHKQKSTAQQRRNNVLTIRITLLLIPLIWRSQEWTCSTSCFLSNIQSRGPNVHLDVKSNYCFSCTVI